MAYQYTILPFGLSLAPHTFTKCMDAALSLRRQLGIRILNYLDDCLILAQSEDALLYHLECLGLSCQERAVPQPMNFVPGNSYRLSPNEGCGYARMCTGHSAARGFIQTQSPSPPQSVSEDAGPHGISVCGTSVGPASHAAPSGLAETSSSSNTLGVTSRTPHVKVNQACVAALAPWKDRQWIEWGVPPGMVCRRKVVWTDASKFATYTTANLLRPLVEEGRLPSHQLPGNAGSMVGPSHLSARPERTSHLNPLGQYDSGVLHKSPGRSFLEAPLYPSRAPLEEKNKMVPSMAAVVSSEKTLQFFVCFICLVFLLFYVLDVVSITVYDRHTLYVL